MPVSFQFIENVTGMPAQLNDIDEKSLKCLASLWMNISIFTVTQ